MVFTPLKIKRENGLDGSPTSKTASLFHQDHGAVLAECMSARMDESVDRIDCADSACPNWNSLVPIIAHVSVVGLNGDSWSRRSFLAVDTSSSLIYCSYAAHSTNATSSSIAVPQPGMIAPLMTS